MTVRTKFICDSKIEVSAGFEIKLSPVISGSAENEQFYKYTPSGALTLGLVAVDSAANFKVGKHYYIDIVQAED